MNKGTKTGIIIGVVALVVILGLVRFFIGTYNRFVVLEEEVDACWAQVESQYQRRLDLIPNLVATVKGYAQHESSVFTEVAEARSSAGKSMELGKEILNDPEAFAQFQQAQNKLSAGIGRLLAVAENYPALKANQNFMVLMDQLEGTENRIATERMRFNDAVKKYNRAIRLFPASIIANMRGFEKKQYFQADESAKTAPKVEF